jgi:hypothetical protein
VLVEAMRCSAKVIGFSRRDRGITELPDGLSTARRNTAGRLDDGQSESLGRRASSDITTSDIARRGRLLSHLLYES